MPTTARPSPTCQLPSSETTGNAGGGLTDHGYDECGHYEVDIEELRARGNDMLGAGDALNATAGKGVMLGHSAYGLTGGGLDRAATRFADRFTYLLRQLGDEAVTLGDSMRGSALAYEEADAIVAQDYDAIAGSLD